MHADSWLGRQRTKGTADGETRRGERKARKVGNGLLPGTSRHLDGGFEKKKKNREMRMSEKGRRYADRASKGTWRLSAEGLIAICRWRGMLAFFFSLPKMELATAPLGDQVLCR
jgi:hypothetical protein